MDTKNVSLSESMKEIMEESNASKDQMNKNSNLYKILSILDVVIRTITEDPTTTIEMSPINWSNFDDNGSSDTESGTSGITIDDVKNAFPILEALSIDSDGNLLVNGKAVAFASDSNTEPDDSDTDNKG